MDPPTYEQSEALQCKEFSYDGRNLEITIYGSVKTPLFKASDVAKVLDIKHINSNLADEKKYRLGKDKVVGLTDTLGGRQKTTFVTRSGLYKLLFASRKPIALEFQNWVCEVLEELLEKGHVALERQVRDLTLQMEKQKAMLEMSHSRKRANNEKLETVYVFETNMSTETTIRPNAYKIGRTLNDREKRLSAMKIGNPNIRSIAGIKCIDSRIVEETCKRICRDYNIHGEFFDVKKEKAVNLVQIVAQFVDTLICLDFDNDTIPSCCSILCKDWDGNTILCEMDDVEEDVRTKIDTISNESDDQADNLADDNQNDQSQNTIVEEQNPCSVELATPLQSEIATAPDLNTSYDTLNKYESAAADFIDKYLVRVKDYHHSRILAGDIQRVFKSVVGFRESKTYKRALTLRLEKVGWTSQGMMLTDRGGAGYTNIAWKVDVSSALSPELKIRDFIRLDSDVENKKEQYISNWIIKHLEYINDDSHRIALADIREYILNENPDVRVYIGEICDKYLDTRYNMDVKKRGRVRATPAYANVRYKSTSMYFEEVA